MAFWKQKQSNKDALQYLLTHPYKIMRTVPELTLAAYLNSFFSKKSLGWKIAGQFISSPLYLAAVRKVYDDREDDFVDILNEAIQTEGPLSLVKGASSGVMTVLLSTGITKLCGISYRKLKVKRVI
ncbi:hypothetical protein GEMRC1_014200 [Eukaryota sp. GEM-RC1]